MESTVPTDTNSLNEDVVVETSFNDSITMSTNTERIDVISQKVQTDTIPQRTRRINVGKSHRVKTSIDVGTQCDLTVTVDNGVAAENMTEGENATEMEHAESDVDSYDPDYNPDDSFHESEEEGDSGDEWETNNCRLEVTDNPMDEKYYLVSESALCELLSLCRVCDSQCIPVIEYSKGTMICTSSVCGNGHVSKWQSQSCHNRLPWGNLLLSSAIMLSGNHTSKVLRLLDHMKVKSPSARTVSRLQSAYTVPAIIEEFDSKQADLLQTLAGKNLYL